MGVNVQLMVFNPEGEKGKGEEIVLVNPRIFKYSNKRTLFTEGCLSFPEIEADVEVKSNHQFFFPFLISFTGMEADVEVSYNLVLILNGFDLLYCDPKIHYNVFAH